MFEFILDRKVCDTTRRLLYHRLVKSYTGGTLEKACSSCTFSVDSRIFYFENLVVKVDLYDREVYRILISKTTSSDSGVSCSALYSSLHSDKLTVKQHTTISLWLASLGARAMLFSKKEQPQD